MRFTKMHGAGNDYIYINCFEETVDNPSALSVKISDRHFGVGADGLVLIMPSKVADFAMRIFNPDGTEAEMCGNAIRCVGKYVYDNGMTGKTRLNIETLAGIKVLDLTVDSGKVTTVKVDMGEPILDPARIPVNSDKDRIISEPLDINGEEYRVTCVSMGNPHAVVYTKSAASTQVEKIGPIIERHAFFPKRTNVEFVEVIDSKTLNMRVWERGTGETLACGTGACAAAVASILNGSCDRNVTVRLKGGNLDIEWNRENNHVYMTGPAVEVFRGIL